MLIGEESSGEGGSVISTQSNEHNSQLWDLSIGLEGIAGLLRSANIFSGRLIQLNLSIIVVIGRDQAVTILLDVVSNDLHCFF